MKHPVVIGLVTPEALADSAQRQILEQCPMLEMRWDLFPSEEWQKVAEGLHSFSCVWLWTVRLQRDGGKWPNDKAQDRLLQLQKISAYVQPDWIDLELEEKESFADWKTFAQGLKAQLLLSHHNFNTSYSAEEWEGKLFSMKKADGAKFAVTFQSVQEADILYSFIEKHKDGSLMAAFSMGALGEDSRKQAPLRGAPWTYGYSGSKPQAPGQVSLLELLEFYKEK